MATPPESDTIMVSQLDATFLARLIDFEDPGTGFSLVGPIAEITHRTDGVNIVIGVPADKLVPGDDARPEITLTFKHGDRVLIRREENRA